MSGRLKRGRETAGVSLAKLGIVTLERGKQLGDAVEGGGTKGAYRVVVAPIDRLRRAGGVTEVQFQAAEALARDFYLGGLVGVGAVDTTRQRVDGGRGLTASERREFHARRYGEAMWAVEDKSIREMVRAVVIDGVDVVEVSLMGAGGFGGRMRIVKVGFLRHGLEAVARFYGLAGRGR